MPQWVVLVPVTVEADTPDEAIAWVREELAARLRPDEGTGWHYEESATPRYRVASVRPGTRGVGDAGVPAGAGMSEERVTVAALAAELGVSVDTVLHDAMVAGVTGYRGPYTAEQAEAIRAARRERRARITQLALADELGVTPGTVAEHAGRLGFGGGLGYTPEQAEAIRRSMAAGRRRRSAPFGAR